MPLDLGVDFTSLSGGNTLKLAGNTQVEYTRSRSIRDPIQRLNESGRERPNPPHVLDIVHHLAAIKAMMIRCRCSGPHVSGPLFRDFVS
jgi:hypothetical protein